MKTPLSLFFLLFLVSTALAGQYQGGEITYQPVSGNTYHININTYARFSSPGDADWLLVDFDDGTIDTLHRDSVRILANEDRKLNFYSGNHTFPGMGNYTLRMQDAGRDQGVLNMQNSIIEYFTIEAELIISNLPANHSVYFDERPIFRAKNNALYRHTPTPIDLDGDSLAYEFVDCLGQNGASVAGYTLMSGLSINPLNGEIEWTPTVVGDHAVALRITEYRDGQVVGSTIRDFIIQVDSFNFSPQFNSVDNWPVNSSGDYEAVVTVGDTVDLSLVFIDNSSFGYDLKCFSESFVVSNPATVQITPGSASMFGTYQWVPQAQHVRNHPYVVTFRGIGSAFPHLYKQDLTLMIYVENSTLSTIEIEDSPYTVELFPNPTKNLSWLRINPTPRNAKLEILDAQGRTAMIVPTIADGTVALGQISETPGIYFYRVEEDGKLIGNGKILIQ